MRSSWDDDQANWAKLSKPELIVELARTVSSTGRIIADHYEDIEQMRDKYVKQIRILNRQVEKLRVLAYGDE